MQFRSISALLAGVALVAPIGWAFPSETYLLSDPRPTATPKAAVQPLSRRSGLDLPLDLPAYALAPIDEARARTEDAQRAETGEKSERYGLGRDIALYADDGVWHELGEGRWLWTGDVISRGALGLRVGLVEMNLPEGAELTVHSPRDPERVAGPYTGDGPFDDGHVWTPTSIGERARVEYLIQGVPPGTTPSDTPFRIARLQHVYREPWKINQNGGAVGACHNDVNCYPELDLVKRSTAAFGSVYVDATFCTGTLMNCVFGDQTPYFLTAHHCLSTPAEAQDMEIFWHYESDSCGGSVAPINTFPQSSVATLLATDLSSDFTLLMIEGALPNGLTWSGWNSNPTPNSTPGFGIHHPSGSFKRVSFGNYSSSAVCGASGNFRVNWTSGVTEQGSSGSGFFRADTQQLVGQLWCGPSSCGGAVHDGYGRFSQSYPAIQNFLQVGTDDYLEGNDTCGGHPDLSSGYYNNLIVKSIDDDWYEMNVPAGAQITVRLYFTHAFGDIDLQLKVDCNDPLPQASSLSNTDHEVVSWVNLTGAANTVAWRVFLDSDTRNDYGMLVSLVPVNDACGTAPLIVNDTTYFGTTKNASNSLPGTCGGTATAPDVWYRYSASQTGVMQISTWGSQIDTVVAVYDGCGGVPLVCNDDANDGSPWGNGTSSSYVSVPVMLAHDYNIRVAGYGGAEGTFQLRVDTDTGAPYCVGDGISAAACPCGNESSTGFEAGCANSTANAGRLQATGRAEVSNETLEFVGSNMPPFSTCLYFQGTSRHNGGYGVVFGDGLRCVGGTLLRLDVQSNSFNGSSQYPSTGQLDVNVRGQVPAGGGWRYYQVWYRNVAAFCTAANFNSTNGYEVYWRP